MNIQNHPIDTLIPYARNSRTHSDEQVAQIMESIEQFGFTYPVLADAQGIVAGHGRVMAATRLYQAGKTIKLPGGEALPVGTLPVIDCTGWTEAQRRAYIIADNKLALNASWDEHMLALEFADLRAMEFDTTLTGFSLDDIDELLAELDATPEGETDADETPAVQSEVKTQPGDVWLLGKHRLMCGDSTNAAAVGVLMAGKKPDMIFTDPPYGIAYSSAKFNGNRSGVTNKRNKAEMIIGDGDDFDPSFMLNMFSGVKEIFIWGYQYYPEKLGRGGIIVWNKKQESESGCPHGDFELCWSKRERNKMCWLKWGGFNNKEKGEDRLHTTQKPVALAEWFFENWGSGANTVLDLFGCSGSTLIACEKTGRRNCSMELDPKYCDVIVRRWQQYTGKSAVHAVTGQEFGE
ncbi:site-specific DNA-methyltransferase [Azonexus sp.]|uniref:site-specific DNA-methyltransferase n=1 Tax=Azonexus sp. TaxID=1872668 RepID=UPI0039E59C49